MMMSQILKCVDFIKTQKSRYLENETYFSSNKKNHELHIKGYFIAKNSFVAEVKYCDKIQEYMVETDKRFVLQKFKIVQ